MAAPVFSSPLPEIGALPAEGAAIVLLGEVHDNPVHHAAQAAAVAAIAPRALVFEMMSPEQAGTANALPRTDAEALEAALSWTESGWPPFALYHPILVAAPEARIYGAAVPAADLALARAEGAAAAWGVGARAAGLGPLPPAEQAAREADQAEAHCGALPQSLLPGMVAAQRLRDARFARTALAALAETGGPVVVITGNGHARTDRGIPVYLAAQARTFPSSPSVSSRLPLKRRRPSTIGS